MGQFRHDMSKEKERGNLLPEGWRRFFILSCQEGVSNTQKPKFVFGIRDVVTEQEYEIHTTSVEGKRWFLKSILRSCEVPAAADGVYDWDVADVLGKEIEILLEHYDDTWINNEGVSVESKKHKFTRVRPVKMEGDETGLPF